MLKKILIIFFTLSFLLLFSTTVLAENKNGIVGNLMNDAKNSVSTGANNIKGALSNGMNTVGNTSTNMANGFKNTTNTIGNTLQDGSNSVVNDIASSDTAGYTATRTSQDSTDMSSNTWLWVILIVGSIIVVGAVWYYASRPNDKD